MNILDRPINKNIFSKSFNIISDEIDIAIIVS